MLYRIDREFDEYQGAGEYEIKPYYQYRFGLRNVAKACLDVEPNDRIIRIVKLNFSLKGLIVCLKKTCSSYYNQTTTATNTEEFIKKC